jgi:hypothetical protein
MSAYIEFEYQGRTWRYTGTYPEALADEVWAAQQSLWARYGVDGNPAWVAGDDLAPNLELISTLGGRVLKVEGKHSDGTIPWSDFEDNIIH